MIVVGILGFGMTATLMTAAYNYIPVGLATMFQFSYPLFVLIIMVILTKEKNRSAQGGRRGFLSGGTGADDGFQRRGQLIRESPWLCFPA